MNCDHYIDWIARRIEGSLSPMELNALQRHLSECPRCRTEVLLQVRIAKSLALPSVSSLPGDFAERVSRRALAHVRAERRAQRWGYLIPVLANAVVVLLAVTYRADIASFLAPLFSAFGAAAGTAVRWVGSGVTQASGPTKAVNLPAVHALGTWGPLVCATVVIVLATSKIYELRRR